MPWAILVLQLDKSRWRMSPYWLLPHSLLLMSFLMRSPDWESSDVCQMVLKFRTWWGFGFELKASTSRLMVIITLHDGMMKRECWSLVWRGLKRGFNFALSRIVRLNFRFVKFNLQWLCLLPPTPWLQCTSLSALSHTNTHVWTPPRPVEMEHEWHHSSVWTLMPWLCK